MSLVFAAFAIASLGAGVEEPWPVDCLEGAACDPRYAARFADPDDYEGVFALTNMSEVFSSDYYPLDALRDLKQGKVRVRLEISPEGKATNCAVVESSRVASLNKVTCSRIMEAGRFKIARDRKGRAKPYKTQLKVSWILPRFDLFRERRMKTVVAIDGAGAIGPCRVEIVMEGPTSPPACPEQLLAQARKIVASAPRKDLIANKELVIEEGLLIGDAAQLKTIGHGPEVHHLKSMGLALKVDANGRVQSCDLIDGSRAPDMFGSEMCKLQMKNRYMPLAKRDPNRQPRNGFYYLAVYLRRPAIDPVHTPTGSITVAPRSRHAATAGHFE